MKKKSLFYLMIGIFGIALIVSAIVLDGRVSDAADGTLMGIGAGLTGLGISRWCLGSYPSFCRMKHDFSCNLLNKRKIYYIIRMKFLFQRVASNIVCASSGAQFYNDFFFCQLFQSG